MTTRKKGIEEVRPGYFRLRYKGHTRVHSGGIRGAQSEYAKLVTEVDTGRAIRTNETVESHVARWLEHGRTHGWSRLTWERYDSVMRLHILPKIGRLPLRKLTRREVDGLLTTFFDAGMGKANMEKCRIALSSAMTQAVLWDLVVGNPVEYTTLPQHNKAVAKAEKAATQEEVLAMIDGLMIRRDGDFAQAQLAIVIAGTGARLGEALGLRWSDLDPANAMLTIDEGIIKPNKQAALAQEPKTDASVRTIEIDSDTIGALREQRNAGEERAFAANRLLDPDAFLWSTDAAGQQPWRPGRVHLAWHRVRDRDFIPEHVTPHSFRHWHGSMLHDAGVSLADVQERLGHARLTTTADIYTHPMGKRNPLVLATIGGTLGKIGRQ